MTNDARRQPVYASELNGTRAVVLPEGAEWPFSMQLTFSAVHGTKDSERRPVHATLSSAELADVLGSIPVAAIGSEDDLQALTRVVRVLRGKK
jgi:hypothetical protein